MNAVKRTETRVVEYWECSIAGHRHKSEAIAESCIAKHPALKGIHWRITREELDAVIAMRESGMTLREIGKVIGRSGETVRHRLFLAIRRRKVDLSDPFQSISTMARNCLWNAGLDTIDAVRDAYESDSLRKIPQLGEVCLAEIAHMLRSVRPVSR